MAEQLVPLDIVGHEKGIKVMGMTSDATLFKGTTIKIVSYNGSTPNTMSIKGTLYNGINETPFKMDFLVEALRIYDEPVFDRLKTLMGNYAIAIENIMYYETTFRELLS